MPKTPQPSYAALVWQLLKASDEPLSAQEIMIRVARVRPIDTNSPLQTIRHAVGQCRLIASTGDGRYGWYPRLINGSRVRVPLVDSDLEARRIVIDDEARELLWPSFFAIQSLKDREPVHAIYADDSRQTTLPLEFYGAGVWGIGGSPEIWKWLRADKVQAGDALIVEAVDAVARRYRVRLDMESNRDEQVVRQRTETVEQAAREQLWNRRAQGCAVWDMAKHLLVAGLYRHPVPPEPISPLWSRVLLQMDVVAAFTGRRKTRMPPGRVYQLKISLQESNPPIWRRVLVPGSATLEDLHWIIQVSMGWTNSHLHQFTIDGACYTDPAFDLEGDMAKPGDEARATLSNVAKKGEGLRFTYEYDFGDGWQHDIEVEKILPINEGESHPRCFDGKRACPPEDCGGMHGYQDFLATIADPSNPERFELLAIADGAFDPERCDLTAINWQLRKLME